MKISKIKEYIGTVFKMSKINDDQTKQKLPIIKENLEKKSWKRVQNRTRALDEWDLCRIYWKIAFFKQKKNKTNKIN